VIRMFRRHFAGRSFLGLVAALAFVVALPAVAVALPALASAKVVSIQGRIVLKPIATNSCKSATGKVNGKDATQLQCSDAGVFDGRPRRGGVANSWLWTLYKSSPSTEVSNLNINFGNGEVDLRLTGRTRVIGKVTTDSGHALTTGSWRLRKAGTGVYKRLAGRGTYSFDIRRNATRYLSLTMTLHGSLS
jgi:hypothetical protein